VDHLELILPSSALAGGSGALVDEAVAIQPLVLNSPTLALTSTELALSPVEFVEETTK
jgi:hypothetical protein